VAERMSLISDALFLEATTADAALRHPVDAAGASAEHDLEHGVADLSDFDTPDVQPKEQARAIAEWIYAGRGETDVETKRATFPGLGWLRQPTTYSDREWILAIAMQYRQLDRAGVAAVS
jgi:hypothetical protein